MTQLTIRIRLIMLSSVLLLVLAATTGYLTQTLSNEAAATAKAADMLAVADQASSARIAFGELRYWNTDLAVSQLTLSEQKAAAARERMERDLDRLAGQKPERITRVRRELADYEQFAGKAVDAYTNDQRVIGNSLLASPMRSLSPPYWAGPS
jgi:adenylate cyclase